MKEMLCKREVMTMRDIFEEIVGYEEIKRELRIISDMLINPDIYKKFGAGLNDGLVL